MPTPRRPPPPDPMRPGRGGRLPESVASHDRLLVIGDVVRRCGLSRSTVYRLMNEGRFPYSIQVGPRAVRWSSFELEEWVAARPPRRRRTQISPRRRRRAVEARADRRPIRRRAQRVRNRPVLSRWRTESAAPQADRQRIELRASRTTREPRREPSPVPRRGGTPARGGRRATAGLSTGSKPATCAVTAASATSTRRPSVAASGRIPTRRRWSSRRWPRRRCGTTPTARRGGCSTP